MKKFLACTTVAVLSAGGAFLVDAGAASAATAPSAQDTAWAQSNAQTDLAEIAIGTIAESRGVSSAVKSLATMTMSDHVKALAELKTVAAAAGITLPTTPNATQQAQASQLQAIPDSEFDLTYDNDQIAGHELSISQTNTEIASGSDAAVIAYAKTYLPVAQSHLDMAEADHAIITGASASSPSVEAGTGGMAATHSTNDDGWFALIALGALAVVGSGAYDLRRRSALS